MRTLLSIWYTLRVRRAVSALIAGLCCALVACGLVACGGSSHSVRTSAAPTPSSAPTSSAASSSAPASSPTATTPLLTGAAVKPGEVPPTQNPKFITDDSAGAISFAGYFYRALDWSIATSNPNLLRPISAASCAPCSRYINEIDAFAAAGGHSEGARVTAFQFAPAQGNLVKSDFVVQVTLNQMPQVLVSADGSRSTPPAPTNPSIVYLYIDWANGRFQAVEIGG
jgi:hypothetical protein